MGRKAGLRSVSIFENTVDHRLHTGTSEIGTVEDGMTRVLGGKQIRYSLYVEADWNDRDENERLGSEL